MNVRRIGRTLVQGAHWRLGLAVLLVALLAMGGGVPARAQSASPDGSLTPDSPGWAAPLYTPWPYYNQGGAGEIYIGAVPPGAANKPVLVFVAGKSGKAQDWWENTNFSGHNDMYEYAYNYGYRTAFVNLWDANGPYWGGTMWENGQMLAGQIETIANYFGVSTVNIVAHSKGGVDTQAAIVYYGASPRVQKVITLDTPHWGTQTANLAYSGPLWWVGVVIGDLTNASAVMTTGYMSYFRSLTDGRPENNNTRYYTTAGTDWGSGALWWSGLFLSAWDSNDGLVTVTNAHLGRWYGTHVRTSAVNHDNVRKGSQSMALIDTYLSTNWRNGMAPEQIVAPGKPEPTAVAGAPGKPAPTAVAGAPGKPEPTAVAGAPGKPEPTAVAGAPGKPEPTAVAGAESDNPTAHVATASILRGGPLTGHGATTTDQITVETGATGLSLDLISNLADLDLSWTAPNGQQYTAQSTADTGEFFNNAYHYVVKVNAPQAGTWRMSIRNTADQPAAYGLVANVSSPLTVTLDRDPALVFPSGSKLPIHLVATDAKGRAISNLHVAGLLRLNTGEPQAFTVPAGRDATQTALELPNAAGLANLTFTVTGQLSDGSAFERTLVTSVAVVNQDGKLPLPASNQAGVPAQP
jgi:triacylglycerol esterase/lipase EstA (alpha/beta hydrolase family)